jgi:hypothetical protein
MDDLPVVGDALVKAAAELSSGSVEPEREARARRG